MWIKGTDGRLHDTTGCTLACELTAALQVHGKTRAKGTEPAEGYSITRTSEVGGKRELLATDLTEDAGRTAMRKIEQAIVEKTTLVEI